MEGRAVFLCVAVLSLALQSLAAFCPTSCVCSTTPDGLHKATCSNIQHLKNFIDQNNHHNINILDLSHNNITTLTNELDSMSELVALDLSTNGIVTIDAFPQNADKLVHVNLANNRLSYLENLPKRLSSLDLRDNLFRNLPSQFVQLPNLEHIQLEGNPLDCSCTNLMLRDYMLTNSIALDNAKCKTPEKYRGVSWLKVKTKTVCEKTPEFFKLKLSEFKGIDTDQLAEKSLLLNFKQPKKLSDLDEGQTWVADSYNKDYENEDEVVFLRAKRQEPEDVIEGSGNDKINNYDQTTESYVVEPSTEESYKDKYVETEGSGEGSGFNEPEEDMSPPVTEAKELITDPVSPFLGKVPDIDDNSLPEDIIPEKPSVYLGGNNWFEKSTTTTTETPAAVGAEKIQIAKSGTEQSQITAEAKEDEKPAVHKTGTYVCIGIIVTLLSGLIGFALFKSYIRKRRDRRLQRQQKRDIEKASKEMVDMNTSLLGKPAPSNGTEKKANGKYELVPTHDPSVKKSENGNLTGSNDPNKNKSSPRDSNQNREENPRSLGTVDAPQKSGPTDTLPRSKKERDSLSSEEIFVPDSEDGQHGNGLTPSDTLLLTNGDHTDSDLSPSKYVPVYSVDMGRVRIKMTETPKPKTPVLVNRSRSNAGDIVVTPSLGQKLPETKT